MDQATAKKTLQELVKSDIKNKNCIDCSNPNPQWASLRSVFTCKTGLPPHMRSVLPCFCVYSALERIEGLVFTLGAFYSKKSFLFHYNCAI